MTPKQMEILTDIRRLLWEAYDDYFKRSDDGYCKSGEGFTQVHYSNYFEREKYLDGAASGISIYSYVLGPHRMHEFDSFEQALAEVKKWHAEEMACNFSD